MIGAKNVYLSNKASYVRLCKIRNPYGMKEWQGDWGDKSKKWTPKTRQQVNGEDKEDGIFFMCLEDYMKFFSRTTICYYMENGEDNFLSDQHEPGSWAMTKFTIERNHPTPLFVTVDQIAERI